MLVRPALVVRHTRRPDRRGGGVAILARPRQVAPVLILLALLTAAVCGGAWWRGAVRASLLRLWRSRLVVLHLTGGGGRMRGIIVVNCQILVGKRARPILVPGRYRFGQFTWHTNGVIAPPFVVRVHSI